MIGQRFSKLVVVDATHRQVGKRRRAIWTCDCDCGAKGFEALGDNVRAGYTQSCGCHRSHRLARSGVPARCPEYRAWQSIKQRCLNPKHPRFADWGGRGISIHELWITDFDAFLAEVGRRPSPGMSVDRIDNSRGYLPGNLRWATATEQAKNRRPHAASVRRTASDTTPNADKE